MRIRVESDPPGPLSLLEELPDARLAMLEGLNGIGKTLTVRLLQVCTGQIPYDTDSAAWRSLCEGLGQFTVTVSGLSGGSTITWRGDSTRWEKGPGLGMDAVSFDSLQIDGSDATIGEVRQRLTVARVAGDEGLIDTLAQDADSAANSIRVWSRRFAAPDAGPLAALEKAIHEVADPWQGRAESRNRELSVDIEDKSTLVDELGDRLADSSSTVTALQTAAGIELELSQFKQRAPGLAAHLSDLDAQIQVALQAREALDKQQAALTTKAAFAGPARKQLQNARRTVQRNRENLKHATYAAAAFAGSLMLPVDDPAAAEAAMREQLDEISDLERRQTEIHAVPAMRGLLGNLATELQAAESSGLGEQVAISDEGGTYALSVHDTRSAFLRRREELEGDTPPPEAHDLTEKLEVGRRRLARIKALLEAHESAARHRRLVATNEDRVTSALVVADPKIEEQLKELDSRRRLSDDLLLKLAAERAGLQEQLGGSDGTSTEEALTAQLAEALADADSTRGALAPDMLAGEAALDHVRQELATADKSLREARRERSQLNADVRRALASLENAEYRWLREALPESLHVVDGKGEAALQAYDAISETLRRALDRLGVFRDQAGALTGALRGLAEHLRGAQVVPGLYSESLEKWLSETFSDWFNLERVREQLLPEATTVAVSVKTREVIWQESAGERSRPLEAFSSGEQAFAYTRARIGLLDEASDEATNRLIVLDEFGAFISHDRLTQLMAYLHDRIAARPGDQVLVILPLSRDYAEMSETAIGDEAKRYGVLAEQIRSREYAVQVLT